MRLNRLFLMATFIICFAGMLMAQTEPVRYAVIVGLADYPGEYSDLTYTYYDAIDIREALLKDPDWKDENITLLLDGAATSDGIKNAIDDMAEKATEQDTCVFFYAGHGNYGTDLEPVDEADGQDEYLCAHDQDICDDDFANWIEAIPSNNIILLIDSCFSGGLYKNQSDDLKIRSRGPRKKKIVKNDSFIDDLFNRKKDLNSPRITALLACDDTEYSYESARIQQSYFTYYLLDTLKYASFDLNQNGMISAEESYQHVYRMMTEVETYIPQTPQIYDGNVDVENDYVVTRNQLRPDLIIDSITGLAGAYHIDDQMDMTVVVRNQGEGPAVKTHLRVTIGTESENNMSYLDFVEVPNLAAGEMITLQLTDTEIWTDIHSGTYQIWGEVNCLHSERFELSEDNNIACSSSFELTSPIVANFSSYPDHGVAPHSIEFYDISTGGPTSFAWDFNMDGLVDSTEERPEYEYTQPGLYSVSLTVSDGVVTDTAVRENFISVSPTDAPEFASEFVSTIMPDTMATGVPVEFIVTMKNTGQRKWYKGGWVKLGAVGDSDPLTDWCRYVTLKDVRYGETYDFTVCVNPQNPGVFLSDWQMLREGYFWFGDVCEKEVTVEQSTNVPALHWGLFQ